MIIVTPQQMETIDKETIQVRGLPGQVLMENAARTILGHVPEGQTAILVGPGNNGGDGLVLARALWEAGTPTVAVLLSETGSPDWNAQKILAQAWEVPLANEDDLESVLIQSDNIVDALFGTGLARPLEGVYAHAIDLANQTDAFRLAIDIPSGINGTTGGVLGTAFDAHRTVTFGHPKWGHFLYPGRERTGELVLTQPGFHPNALGMHDRVRVLTAPLASQLVPRNWSTMHKGDNGRLLLCTGSETYPGAGILSALGALRGGGGLVTHWGPLSVRSSLNTSAPEALVADRESTPDLAAFDALVLGCGLGEAAAELSPALLQRFKGPVVVDADSLPWVAEVERSKRSQLVLTPHPGEMARLLKCTVEKVEESRIETALLAAADLGCVVCLKGAPTVTACPEGRVWVNSTGNPLLAQGGSGDVLAGLMGAYLAYGLPTFEAVAGAVYVHGLAADILAADTPRGLPASALAETIPAAYSACLGG